MDDDEAVAAIAETYANALTATGTLTAAGMLLGIKRGRNHELASAETLWKRIRIYNDRIRTVRAESSHLVGAIDQLQMDRIDSVAFSTFGTLPGFDVSVATLCMRHLNRLLFLVNEVDISAIQDEIDAYHLHADLQEKSRFAKADVDSWSQELVLNVQTTFDRLKRLDHACRTSRGIKNRPGIGSPEPTDTGVATQSSQKEVTKIAGSTAEVKSKINSVETQRSDDLIRVLSFYSNNVLDDRMQLVAKIANSDRLVNEKLEEIDLLLPIPVDASSRDLGKLLNCSHTAVSNTDWWTRNRRGRQDELAERRTDVHKSRAKTSDGSWDSADG